VCLLCFFVLLPYEKQATSNHGTGMQFIIIAIIIKQTAGNTKPTNSI